MFAKKKFNETQKQFSVLTIPTTANVEKWFSVLTFLSTKLRNILAPSSLDRLMQLKVH